MSAGVDAAIINPAGYTTVLPGVDGGNFAGPVSDCSNLHISNPARRGARVRDRACLPASRNRIRDLRLLPLRCGGIQELLTTNQSVTTKH
jgi:hypothetical protein